jgi:hypothetical protein
MRCSVDGDCSQSTSAHCLTETADAMTHFFTFFLAVAAEQLGGTGGSESALGQMATVMRVFRVIVAASCFLADVDHAVIAAVILVAITAATTRLGDGVAWAELTAASTLSVVPITTVVVAVGISLGIGAAHQIVVCLAGIHIDVSGFMNNYWLLANDHRCRRRRSLQVVHGPGVVTVDGGLGVLTFVVISFVVPVVAAVIVVDLALALAADDQLAIAGVRIIAAHHELPGALPIVVRGNDVTLDGDLTRIIPITVAITFSVDVGHGRLMRWGEMG